MPNLPDPSSLVHSVELFAGEISTLIRGQQDRVDRARQDYEAVTVYDVNTPPDDPSWFPEYTLGDAQEAARQKRVARQYLREQEGLLAKLKQLSQLALDGPLQCHPPDYLEE